jgi:acetoin utilization deacetylase AcuC-like enzyme
VLEALSAPAFANLARRDAPKARLEQIALVHRGDFAQRVLALVPKQGYATIDADTVISPGSGEAALRAAGACIAAVDAVMKGEAQNAFCAVRPPGHHAVHHGNGTQAAFERDAALLYASTHQMPLYPGTGAASERGIGNIVNAPLRPMSGSEEFRKAFSTIIIPALEAFRPELVIISAGFDAHRDDPLAQLMLLEADYAWSTERLAAIAKKHAQGRIVSSLEGGYNLRALAGSAAAHVAALLAA